MAPKESDSAGASASKPRAAASPARARVGAAASASSTAAATKAPAAAPKAPAAAPKAPTAAPKAPAAAPRAPAAASKASAAAPKAPAAAPKVPAAAPKVPAAVPKAPAAVPKAPAAADRKLGNSPLATAPKAATAAKTTVAAGRATAPGAAAVSKPVKAAAPSVKAAPGARKAAKPAAAGTGAKGSAAPEAAAPSASVAVVADEAACLAQAVEEKRAQEQRAQELQAKAAAEMEALRKAAWVAQVERERREEAKQRQEREAEAARRKEEVALRKNLLELAYEGGDAALTEGLQRAQGAGMLGPFPVEAADGHGNTLLSEAAAGGATSTAAMLLQLGANPNTRGEFGRTPLWRAAFLSKADVVPVLLEGGADPRIGNEAGELPEHVAPPGIREVLASWDVNRTDQIVAAYEARCAERAAAAHTERREAVRSAEASVAAAEQAHQRTQQVLRHARQELEKRIAEYDLCVEEQKPESLTQVALDQVHLAESAVDDARKEAVHAAEAWHAARARLRDRVEREVAEDGQDASHAWHPVAVKDLNDVLLRDVGGRIATSGRWPLVIDPSGQAAVFLRYADTNYVNALSSRSMETQRLRRSLLGALRYGKPLVLDVADVSFWDEMRRLFDQVEPGLLAALLDKSLLLKERYSSLIREEDGDEYAINQFQEARLAGFAFIVYTSAQHPEAAMMEELYALRVHLIG